MKKLLAVALLLLASVAGAQTVPTPVLTTYATTNPTPPNCSKGAEWMNTVTNHVWKCRVSGGTGTWIDTSTGGGGVTFPLLGTALSCVTPPYSFTGAVNSGMCNPADKSVQITAVDGATTFNNIMVPTAGSEAASFGGFNATNFVNMGLNVSTANLGISLAAFGAVNSAQFSMGANATPAISTSITDGTNTFTAGYTTSSSIYETKVQQGNNFTRVRQGVLSELTSMVQPDFDANAFNDAKGPASWSGSAFHATNGTVSWNWDASGPSYTFTAADAGTNSTFVQATPLINSVFATDGTLTSAHEVSPEGARDVNTGAKPTCDASARGRRWFVEGGGGVADTYEACMKSAANTFAWVVIATNP